MHYSIIFDVTQTGFRQWSALVVAMVFGCSPIAIIFYKRWAWWRALDKRIKFVFFLSGWICLIGSWGFFTSYPNYRHLQTAMKHSECAVTEGIVTELKNTTRSRSSGVAETFVVNGLRFSYRDGSAQNGFNQIGIIRNGIQVRIFYYIGDNPVSKDIARLEIAQ